MPKKKLQSRKTRQVGKTKSVSKSAPRTYAQAIKRIVKTKQDSRAYKQAAAREQKAREQKAAADKRIKEARKLIASQKEVSKSAKREIKLAKEARKKAVTAAKRTAAELKKETKSIAKDAKKLYRIIGKRSPRKKDIEGAIKEEKKKEKGRRISTPGGTKIAPEKLIEQAIEELEHGPGFRRSILKKDYDAATGIVKITILGKDYSKTIKGKIVRRENSIVREWKWETKIEKL